MSITITVDTSRLEAKLSQIAGGLEKAKRRAAARTATHTKKVISDKVRERIAVKASTVKENVSSKKQGDGQVIRLSKSDRVSLRQFGARQTKKGVSYRIGKTGKRGFVPSAFIVESLHGQVFKRVGAKRAMTKGRYIGKIRQPIQKLWGPSPWGAFTGGKNQKTVQDATPETVADTSDFYRKRLEHEISFVINQANG